MYEQAICKYLLTDHLLTKVVTATDIPVGLLFKYSPDFYE